MQEEYKKAYEGLIKFAALRPRSQKEIDNWFKRKKVSEALRDKLVGRLKDLDLLDDRRFAAWWVEQRQYFKPRGGRLLSFELKSKGVDKSIIDDVLAGIEIDEAVVAKKLVEKNAHKWARFDDRKKQEKMISFLQRKGFGWDAIKDVVK